MTVTHLLHRHAETLEHLLSYRIELEVTDVKPARTEVDHFAIALAREPGTPALEVARHVGERLGWTVYDQEVPARIAHELHMPAAVVKEVDERRQSWLMECVASFSSPCHLSESRYFRHLLSVIRSLGQEGRCVIVGHGAEFILPARSTLRVRLVGNREDRIADVARRLHLDHWKAEQKLCETSRERCGFLREHFHVDPTQPRYYDLVLNTSQWSPSDCADFILRALHHKSAEQRMP
ncbi:MAG TPA: cytidylate kinase-like family protein [Gemmataceae bacterium]|nr:cytidylate kinase-like family protein [Gemmataceae bacterium]